MLPQPVRLLEVVAGAGPSSLIEERLRLRWQIVRRTGCAIEVETEDEICVEDEPAPLIDGQVACPQHVADDGEGRREVQVVVQRGCEPLVEDEPGRGQGSGGLVSSI